MITSVDPDNKQYLVRYRYLDINWFWSPFELAGRGWLLEETDIKVGIAINVKIRQTSLKLLICPRNRHDRGI